MQDMKLTDQFLRHLQGMELQDMKLHDKIVFHYITMTCACMLYVVVIFFDTNTIMHCM